MPTKKSNTTKPTPRAVVVTTAHKGVFFGYVADESKLPSQITLTQAPRVIEGCFLNVAPVREHLFDSVVMNPPFSAGQECAHILHALRFLRPGGRLASVASAGVLFRETAPYKALRARLDELGAEIDPLPEGTFASEGTCVRTVLIRAITR